MNLIIENWRKFLKEESRQDYSILNTEWISDFLHKRATNRDIANTIKTRYGVDPNNLGELELAIRDMIQNAPDNFPLKTKAVKKALGAGTFGIALLMPDDLVLKVYWGSFEPTSRTIRTDDSPEREKYTKIQDKLLDPVKGSVTDPNIIDQGTVRLKGGSMGWVLMSKFDETLFDLIKRIMGSINDDNQRSQFYYEIAKLFEKINPDLIKKTPKLQIRQIAPTRPDTVSGDTTSPYGDATAPAKKPKKINESSLSVDKIDKEINMMKQKYKKFGLDIKEMDRLKVIFKNILQKLPDLKKEAGNLADVRPPNIGLVGDNPVFFDY